MIIIKLFFCLFITAFNCFASDFDANFFKQIASLKISNSYSPEQKSALRNLKELAKVTPGKEQILSDITFDALTTKNSKFFTTASTYTPHLPHKNSWRWNQSRGRTDFRQKGMNFSFFKLSTRKAKGYDMPSPLYKIWIISITGQYNEIAFIWCEKGHEDNSVHPAQKKLVLEDGIEDLLENLPETTLEELKFLAPLVSRKLAAELGWIGAQ